MWTSTCLDVNVDGEKLELELVAWGGRQSGLVFPIAVSVCSVLFNEQD